MQVAFSSVKRRSNSNPSAEKNSIDLFKSFTGRLMNVFPDTSPPRGQRKTGVPVLSPVLTGGAAKTHRPGRFSRSGGLHPVEHHGERFAVDERRILRQPPADLADELRGGHRHDRAVRAVRGGHL